MFRRLGFKWFGVRERVKVRVGEEEIIRIIFIKLCEAGMGVFV